MKNNNKYLKGVYFMQGDIACAEAAIMAGCRFFAGYPITPASEIAERLSYRLPIFEDGAFIQMEDEIASMAAILGGSWAGVKSMTATSGPGLSLMNENLGLGYMMEVPCVIVNVQRGSPSTGLPTHWGQSDMMQAKFGTHGDVGVIGLCPKSPQELFDLTITSFNLSEKYRLPVIILTDAIVGHMTERVVIPPIEEIELVDRKYTNSPKDNYYPYKPDPDLIPPFAKAGDGYAIHSTGLTHNEKGYPDMTEKAHINNVTRIIDKIHKNKDDIIMLEETNLEDCDVVVVSYGITARTVVPAIEAAKKKGIKVGMLRLITAWPFCDEKIKELAKRVSGFVVVELNMGQMVREVERFSGSCRVKAMMHPGGGFHKTDDIVNAIVEVSK